MKFEWEEIYEDGGSFTKRAKVFGGWILRHSFLNDDDGIIATAMVFIPDPKHEWDLTDQSLIEEFKNQPIDVLELTVRVTNVCRTENIKTVRDLVEKKEWELRIIPNLGCKSLKEIIQALSQHGLSLS